MHAYRKIIIADSRDWFNDLSVDYSIKCDLVLTYDFGLKEKIEQLGGCVMYIDCLVDRDIMQDNNFRVYRFFGAWHLDEKGSDVFSYKGIAFGFALRLYFWTDYLFYARCRLCLSQLKGWSYKEILVGTSDGVAKTILRRLGIAFSEISPPTARQHEQYYFPIQSWMASRIDRRGIKAYLVKKTTYAIANIRAVCDSIVRLWSEKPLVFIQIYHPTQEIYEKLRSDDRIRVVTSMATRDAPWGRFVPIGGENAKFAKEADDLLIDAQARLGRDLVLSTGDNIASEAYEVIFGALRGKLARILRELDSVISYLDRNPVNLVVLIANIGPVATLVDAVCKSRGVPSFLIINGLLGPAFCDESKYATMINSYSENIKNTYFNGMGNIVCLGDPRMDVYKPVLRRQVQPGVFRVCIGASGHNNIDLNSYLAVEFEFLNDVLRGLVGVKTEGVNLEVTIKVRANGYKAQYVAFCREYFPGVVRRVTDERPFANVLKVCDCYISIYSQTLFEASCMGIPAIYYRKDREILDAPFDGRSELVTVDTAEELTRAVLDARLGDSRFSAFLDRSVMEHYVGPLDGGNLQRNLAII